MKLFGQLLIASLLGLLSLGSPARAADHIKDNLELFSEKAKAQANQQIDQVYKNHGWTIAIETRDASTIPDLPKEKTEQDEFLTKWTTKEYVDNRLEGVYLVIFKNPNKFRLHIDTDQQKKMGVTLADTRSWLNLLGENLKEKKYDLALLSTVGNISAKLSQTNSPKKAAALGHDPARHNAQGDAHAAHEGPANEGSSMLTWLLVGGGVLIIFLILRSVLRGMNQGNAGYGSPNQYGPSGTNMGQPGYGPGYGAPGYGGGRGGGFMSGMLGGLFGGMAGNWMYDKMRGDHSTSDSGQGHFTSHDSSRDDYGSSLADNSSAESDSTTYGGDWGNDASSDTGGGDWGGDGGGGDFGGDSGGGDSGGDW